MEILTKQTMARLQESDIQVRLVNGCFKVATAEAVFSRHKVELTVEVTHPMLVWQCGDRREVRLTLWRGCSGFQMDVPEGMTQLAPLIERMREAATMSDEDALHLKEENCKLFLEACESLGIS